METTVRIEDNFEDVLNKAMAGLRMRKGDLCERTGLSRDRIVSLLAGHADRDDLLAVAEVLELHGPSLLRLAEGIHRPEPPAVTGLRMYTTPFPVPGYAEMTVNSFLVVDPDSHKAVAFDTGSNVDRMLADIRKSDLHLEMILVTHSHGDHVAALEVLTRVVGATPVWLNERESLPGALPFREGKSFAVGSLRIESRLTHGHSPGGTTYVITGLERPVAIVGDSLFCYSQGGAPSAYRQALKNNQEKILSLPDHTVLGPGHGPMTTVAEEKAHNPFYPDLK